MASENTFYSDALSRGADAGATAYWSAVFAAGASRAQIAEAIFTALPQPGQSANEYRLKLVDSYYEQFLNRSAAGDPASNPWAALLQNGLRDEAVIAAIMATQEFFNDSV